MRLRNFDDIHMEVDRSNERRTIHRCSSFFDLGRFAIPEEFSVDQLYDIYMQKHALDDLAFSVEFKVD